MTYAELTATQQQNLATADRYYRALFSRLANVFRDSDATTMATWLNTNVAPIIQGDPTASPAVAPILDAGQIVPNTSNFAGSSALDQQDFASVMSLVTQLSNLYSTNVGLVSQVIGTSNATV